MLEIAYLSFKKSKIFRGGGHAPQTPLEASTFGGRLGCLRILVKPCIYMLVAAVIQTCRLELLEVPRLICPLQLHILKRGPCTQICPTLVFTQLSVDNFTCQW